MNYRQRNPGLSNGTTVTLKAAEITLQGDPWNELYSTKLKMK
jgi:hypothetical protein